MTTRSVWVLGIGAGVFVLAWLAVVVGYFAGVQFITFFGLMTVAALVTQGFFWLVGTVLGPALVEVRESIRQAVR